MTDIGIRDISVSFRDNKISNISLVQGDALTRGFDITFVNAKGETLPVDDDYVVELIAVNSKDKDTPYACRHEVVDDKYRVMIPPEALSESGSVTIQLVFYQKSTKAVIHTIKQKCPVYQSIGQEFVESNNLYVDITALRLGLEKIEKLDGKYEEIIEKDIEIQTNETERKEAEGKRNLNEAIRKENEKQRGSNEEKREQLKTALIELKNSIESDLESINLTVDDIISSEDDRKQNEIIREEIKVELENLVADIQNKLDSGDFVGEKGEQGIQGEQGPQGPPGEVSQEEFDNFKDANSLKIAKLEKELQNYKSTMANINVNQEVKQSVSGYGSVSLPKNTANGQVSVSVKGRTLFNHADNGENYSKWIVAGTGSTKGVNGIHLVQDGFLEQARLPLNLKPSTQYTLVLNILKTNLTSGWVTQISSVFGKQTLLPKMLGLNKVVFTTNLEIPDNQLNFAISSPNIDGEYVDFEVYGIYEGDQTTNPLVDYPLSYGTKSTISASRLKSVGKNLFDGILEPGSISGTTGLNLSDTSWVRSKNYIEVSPNTTYTLSSSKINANVRCYDISKAFIISINKPSPPNVFTTPPNCVYIRITNTTTDLNVPIQLERGAIATSYEPYTESTQYLPNVGELRSLPNGVCDEVRVSGGKAELVKRVSDEFAVPMSGWYFNYINEQGFILLINYMTLPNFRTQTYGEFIYNKGMIVNNSNLPAYTTTGFVGIRDNANTECIAAGYLNGLNLYIVVHQDNYNKTQDHAGATAWVNENMQGVTLTYQLAEPITTPIEVNGTLLSYPSGTVYVEKVLPVAGIYTDEITIAHTDFPISSLDKISKIDFITGVETQLDLSKAVVATDKLSFTHTDLTTGDIVFFEYFYANESTQGELELEYYDSRHVLKDSVTGKFYKIIPTVANGVLTNGLLEV